MMQSMPNELAVPTVLTSGYKPPLTLTRRTQTLVGLVRSSLGYVPRNALVVGCGDGQEAAALAAGLGATVTGVDLRSDFDPVASCHATLLTADAMTLPFSTGSFDFVYSYHALEHIADPGRALDEMRRVLRPGMSYFVGTPNRSRIVAYINSPGTSVTTRIKWNLVDWRARLRGRFRNECGAHAGFTARELATLLQNAFGAPPHHLSEHYYRRLYSGKQSTIRFLCASGVSGVVFPSVYFIGESIRR